MKTPRATQPWLNYLLGAACAGAILAAILVVGPASGNQSTVTRTAKAAEGVVQSTVSGSGNLQAASQLNLGFKTSGTVTNIYMTQGQQVTQGQLLATLNPQSAEVTLEQAKASLQSAEANLAKEEETNGETSAGQSSGAGAGNSSNASTASVGPASTTTPAPAKTTPKTTSTSGHTTPTSQVREPKETKSSSSPAATVSPATREANLASARAAVKSDKLTVQSDEEAVQNTKLYAPEDGTIVSLSGQVGEVVSPSGTTKAPASSSSSSGSGAAATGGASTAARSAASSSSSTGASSSTSSSFAVLSDLSSMQLVVPLSESEIGNVKDGQTATVTVEALNGAKLAAHVRAVAILSTSSSGAVSYDVTFQLDQMEPGLKPGMSATAEVVVKQAEGVNVPTSAISAASVTVERSGKQMRQRVTTGLAGNTSTIVLSGLKAGETVVLPAASSTSSSTSLTSRLGSRLGRGGGGLGGGGAGFAGGGATFFRGGG
jgi:multidrug efflux pump subunit AcrA (membrane-fusion protein)